MSFELLFWILMLLWLVFGWWYNYVPGQPYPVRQGAWSFLLFILLAILGWKVFGSPVHP